VKVLLTGGAGYVGSRVAAHLLDSGHDVTVFDSLVYGGLALLPFVGRPEFNLVKGDVRDREALKRAMSRSDAVVHLAAVVGEAACSLDRARTLAINRDAAIAALDTAAETSVGQFIFFSTCSNYGVSDPESLVNEDAALRPLSLYATTKVEAEQALLASTSGVTVTVLRLGTICGVSARMRFDLLVSEMARAAALDLPIEIYKPAAWRPYLHIADAGRAVELLLRTEKRRIARRVFNVVGENYQKLGLAQIVRDAYPNAQIRIVEGAPDKRDYRVDGSRIERELGFVCKHTVAGAFLETSSAVRDGIFVDPMWEGHSAVPLGAQQAQVAV